MTESQDPQDPGADTPPKPRRMIDIEQDREDAELEALEMLMDWANGRGPSPAEAHRAHGS